MSEGSHTSDISRHSVESPPVADVSMRYDDLKPKVRAYLDNLWHQVSDLMKKHDIASYKDIAKAIGDQKIVGPDARRIVELCQAIQYGLKNDALPPEAKREARAFREKVAEQYREIQQIMPKQSVFDIVASIHIGREADILEIMLQVDRKLFDTVKVFKRAPEYQYAVVEAFARNGEWETALKRADRLDPRTFGGVFDHSLREKYDQLFIELVYYAVQQKKFDVAEKIFQERHPKNDHVFEQIIVGVLRAKAWEKVPRLLNDLKNFATAKPFHALCSSNIARKLRLEGMNTKECLDEAFRVTQIPDASSRRGGRHEPYVLLGKEFIHAGRVDDAFAIFETIAGPGFDPSAAGVVRVLFENGQEHRIVEFVDRLVKGSGAIAEAYLEYALCLAKNGGDPASFLAEADRYYVKCDAAVQPFFESKRATIFAQLGDTEKMKQCVLVADIGNRAFTFTSEEIAHYFSLWKDFAHVLNEKTGNIDFAIQMMKQYVQECRQRNGGEEVVEMCLQVADVLFELKEPSEAETMCMKASDHAFSLRRIDLLLDLADYCIQHKLSNETIDMIYMDADSLVGKKFGLRGNDGRLVEDYFTIIAFRVKNDLDYSLLMKNALAIDDGRKKSVSQWVAGHLKLAKVYLDKARELEIASV